MKQSVMVLYQDTDRDEFVEVMEEFGFANTKTHESTGETDPYWADWFNSDRTLYVQYVEEPRLGVRYAFIKGSDIDGFAREFATQVDWYGVDGLYEYAASVTTHNDAVDAMFRIAAATFVADNMPPAARSVFAHFLDQDHWMTRRAAVQAIAYGCWPEGIDMLQQVIDADADERVREFAAAQLRDLRQRLAAAGSDSDS